MRISTTLSLPLGVDPLARARTPGSKTACDDESPEQLGVAEHVVESTSTMRATASSSDSSLGMYPR